MRGRMRLKWVFSVTLLVTLFAVGLAFSARSDLQPIDRSNPNLVQQKPETNPPEVISTRLLIVGDTFWGRQTEVWSNGSPEPTQFPFQGLNTFEREKYDAWIGTMECPITPTPVDFERQKNELKFNCLPEYLEEAKKWFSAFNTASNHTDNMQEVDGFNQTLTNLEKHGIQHFGHFDAGVNDEICEIISVPARAEPLGDSEAENSINLPIGFCGYNNVYRLPTERELDAITPISEYFFTIATPQQGEEYKPSADSLKTEYFRKMIDKGADSIVGGQPHWVQNSEVYKNKLIAYSVGNFMFDQRWNPELMRGIGIDITLSAKFDDNLKAWLEISNECKNHNDSCLEKAQAKQLKKIDYEIKYELVAVDATNKFSAKGSDELLASLKERTNWTTSMNSLKQ